MGAGDGTVIGTTQLVDNGSASNRFNLVIVAEGYRAAEMSQFHTDAQDFVDHLFSTPPFGDLQAAFNVFRVDVSSTESGADDPVACSGSGASPATYFDASFCNGGIRRLMSVNAALVVSVVDAEVPQWHQVLVIVNSNTYGGAGGSISISSTGGNWLGVCLHELGHSAFGLADEYQYWQSCATDVGHDHYTGGEPAAANVTTNADPTTIKWRDLIAAGTPMPTMPNPDCSKCNYGTSPVPDGTVGAFEGAYYHHCGIFRPEYSCMMSNLSGFCAVCRRRIEQVMEPYLPSIFDFFELDDLYFEEVNRWILERWILIAYLIINFRFKDLTRGIRTQPGRELFDLAARHMHAYIYGDTMPPDDIAGAILNLADDYMAGNQLTLRAGDYIALQSHLRRIRK